MTRSADSSAPFIHAIQSDVCSPAKWTRPSTWRSAGNIQRSAPGWVQPQPPPAKGVLLPGLVGDADDLAADAGEQLPEELARGGHPAVAMAGELERLGVEHVGVDHAEAGVGLL
jgi:hypothetical protein